MRTLYFWCTSCYSKRQSRAETSAPPESVQLRVCVHYAFVTVRVRRPIGLRSVSDQIAFGVRSDCVRCPMFGKDQATIFKWCTPALHGKQQWSICHDEKVAYRPLVCMFVYSRAATMFFKIFPRFLCNFKIKA